VLAYFILHLLWLNFLLGHGLQLLLNGFTQYYKIAGALAIRMGYELGFIGLGRGGKHLCNKI